MTTNYTNVSLQEQIDVISQGISEAEEASRYNNLLTIATLTWLLLSLMSVFIYCCNYWELFLSPRTRRRRWRRATSQLEDESDQLELEQQSMLNDDWEQKWEPKWEQEQELEQQITMANGVFDTAENGENDDDDDENEYERENDAGMRAFYWN
ncbi:hypothetical protein ACLKA7_013877 [Drosophila subpalustris]